MLKRKPNQKGFTIIELLVVIVIIGILVALALPQLFAAQERGRDTDRKNNAKNIQQQLEAYFNDEGQYPIDLATLVTNDYLEAVPEPPRESDDDYEDDYTPAPAGCDNTATSCSSFELAVLLENENDPDADGTTGEYIVESVNQ